MKRLILVVAFLVLGSMAALAQDWWQENSADYPPISLELNAWLSDLGGSARWSQSKPGTSINFKDDTGVSDDTFGPYIRLNIGLSDRWTLRLSFWHTKHQGTADLEDKVVFGDVTFPKDIETETTLAVDAYYALAGHKFIDGEQLDFILMFGLAAFSTRMELENTDGLQRELDSVVASPAVGVGIDLALSKDLLFRSQIVGFAADMYHANGQWFDAEGAFNLTLVEGIYFTAGYKFFRTNVDFDRDAETNSADFRMQGPFFGIGLVF